VEIQFFVKETYVHWPIAKIVNQGNTEEERILTPFKKVHKKR